MDGHPTLFQTPSRLSLKIVLLACLATSLVTADAQIFGGRKGPRTGDDPAATFAAAEAMASRGETSAAISAYKALAKQNPRSDYAPRALAQAAQLQEQSRDLMGAYRTLDDLVSNYPKSPGFNQALQAQFRIATQFLDGERLKLLGIRTFPSMERAAEMFESIVKAGPFSDIAPAAQFNIGLAHEKAKNRAEAIAAYQRVVELYPDSALADDAYYQIGYVLMQGTRGAQYDQQASQRALDAFQEFVLRFPRSEKVPQALENIERLQSKRTESSLSVAQFYDRQGNTQAARIYYNLVLEKQPGSEEAAQASRRLAELDASGEGSAGEIEKERSSRFLLGKMVPKVRLPSFGRRESREDEDDLSESPSVPVERPQPKPELRTSVNDVLPQPLTEEESEVSLAPADE